MSWRTKFELNPISDLSANAQKLFHLSEARNSVEHDQKLIRPRDVHNEFANQNLAQFK